MKTMTKAVFESNWWNGGLGALVLGVAVVLWNQTDDVMAEVGDLKVMVENRVTRLETKVDLIQDELRSRRVMNPTS